MGYGDPNNVTNNINPSTKIESTGDAAAIIDFARRRTEPLTLTFKDPEGIAPDTVMIVGHDKDGGSSFHTVNFGRDAYRAKPIRRKGTITTTTLESFVALVNRQSGDESVIFADDGEKPSLAAVINFHEEGGDGAPAWCDDRVVYPFPLSDEWKAWTEQNRKPMDQASFAEWIENRLFDIAEPGSAGAIAQRFAEAAGVKLSGPQALRGLSKGLSIRVEHKVSRIVNLQSGEGRMEFSEEHKGDDGQPLTIPCAFHILIPVFRSGARYSIPVRLRYRTGGGKVSWFFELHEPHTFREDAVNDALAIVRREPTHKAKDGEPYEPPGCGLPVFMGAPPS
jgi:uncharacterized protein YfdQ (DUF2303 family)